MMKHFNIMWVHWEIHFKGGVGGFMKKLMYRENCLKSGGGGGGGLAKKEGNALYVKIQIIDSYQAEFSYPALFEVVWLTLAPINIHIK